MDVNEAKLPSASDYVHAFRAIEGMVTDKQREMLRAHHGAPARVTSATRLAEVVGYDGYGAVNLQYGKLAGAVSEELGYDLGERVKLGVLVDFVDPQYAANAHWLWAMRLPVAQALEDLGWVERTTHMLYPETALLPGPDVADGV